MKRLSQYLGGCIVLVAILVSLWTILRPGFFAPHDFTHGARIAELARGLQAGEFPVRWSTNFGFGYGMPLFTFYAPLPYYIGALAYLVGFGVIGSIKLLFILETLIAAVSMYVLSRAWWGKWGGVISSTLFVLASYRALDLYVRGALGEAFALSFIPLAIYGVTRISKRERGGVLWLAIGLACTLLSHNLTGLVLCAFLLPFLVVYTIQAAQEKQARAFCLQACWGVVLGIGLSAFYTVPAFLEKSLTRVSETITTGYFDYHNHFLCNKQLVLGTWKYGASLPGCSDDLSFAIGIVPIVVAVFVGALIYLRGKQRDKVLVLLAGGVTATAAFMTIGRSVWIWDHVSVLSYFQFPWRLLVFVHVGMALLCGALAVVVKKRIVVVTCMVSILMIVFARPHFLPQQWLSQAQLQQYYQDSPTFIRTEVSKTLNDYLPPGIKDTALPSPVDTRIQITGTITKITDHPSLIHVNVVCTSACPVDVHIFHYPGWHAVVDGHETELIPTQEKTYKLELPAGTHDLVISLRPTPVQQASLALSAVSLGVLLVILVRNFKMKQVY